MGQKKLSNTHPMMASTNSMNIKPATCSTEAAVAASRPASAMSAASPATRDPDVKMNTISTENTTLIKSCVTV